MYLIMDTKLMYIFVSMMIFFNILLTISKASGLGFDSGISGSCNQKMSRQGRAQFLKGIPCDLSKQSYCNLPGSLYPWHAVRRFVHENQGLMKRMYGDVHHISVLRNEIQKNDLDFEELDIKSTLNFFDSDEENSDIESDDIDENDNIRKSKYLHPADYQNSKLSQYGISQPHFRPTSSISSNQNSGNKPTKISPANFNESKIKYNNNNNQSPESEKFIKKHYQMQKVGDQTTPQPEIEKPNKGSKNESNNDESNDVYETSYNQIEENKEPTRNSIVTKVITNNNIYNNGNSDLNGDDTRYNSTINNIENKSENNFTISTTLNVVKQIIQSEMEIESKTIDNKKHDENNIESKQNFKDNSTDLADLLLEKLQIKLSSPSLTSSETTTVSSIFLKSNQTENSLKRNTEIEATTTELNNLLNAKEQQLNDNDNKTKTTNNKTQVLEGQLFQDTIQKDPPNLTNLRGVNACPTKEEVVAPFWANNTRGEVLALLNLYPFEQYVHWERCTNEHKQMYCREGCRCEQQYSLHRLLAYDPHDECRGIFSDWFRFPSCCICKCYNIPVEIRTTSRSPRSDSDTYESKMRLIDIAIAEAHRAVYDHAVEDWYRPKDNLD